MGSWDVLRECELFRAVLSDVTVQDYFLKLIGLPVTDIRALLNVMTL